jgi:NADPH:quinone reductase-like Zn-dependent oxidoreductase
MSQRNKEIANLSPEKLQLLLKRIKPGAPGIAAGVVQKEPRTRFFKPGADPNYYLDIHSAGVLDSLHCRITSRGEPASDEVEVEIYAASLNFRDVMIALGMYPLENGQSRPRFGLDYSGRVARVGSAVTRFKAGDEIMGLAKDSFGALGLYTVSSEDMIMPKPAFLSHESACAIPGVLLTAYYALCEVGRLSRDETVLIHSAAGGVGLAAVQIAQWIGARILATTGTPEKRKFLESLGIRHIMDSRSLGFFDEVLALTSNQGVDLVLNSLAGEAIDKGIKLLRPFGRFLELGRKDLLENRPLGMLVFEPGVVVAGVNIGFRASQLHQRMYGGIARLINERIFKPLPIRTFPISQAMHAFEFMATGKHIGKIVLSIKDCPVEVDVL